jgi:LmbE family N-acetylglucosaminyl deacetylase
MRETVIIFTPHPDDETLACGGSIALHIKLGNEVHIVYMTDGRNSHSHTFGILNNPSPIELKAIRNLEAKRAAKILGVRENDLIFLEYEDLSLTSNNFESAIMNVKNIIQLLKPDVVYCPSVQDSHHDHKATNLIVHKSVESHYSLPKFYHYTIWRERRSEINGERVSTDISDVLTVKKRAVMEYRSQITIFSPEQKRPVLTKHFLSQFFKGEEEFYSF